MLGNRITLTYPGGEIVRYAYYADGQVTDIRRFINQDMYAIGEMNKPSRKKA